MLTPTRTVGDTTIGAKLTQQSSWADAHTRLEVIWQPVSSRNMLVFLVRCIFDKIEPEPHVQVVRTHRHLKWIRARVQTIKLQ